MRLYVALASALGAVSCATAQSVPRPCSPGSKAAGLPFCDTKLGTEERITDLLGRLTLVDKVALLGNSAGAVPDLDLPAYQWWSEALHGVAYSPGVTFDAATPWATVFPQVITTSHAFNLSLVHAIAAAISTEARAFSNAGHAGLTFWAPNINIFRDPRWGRGHETPGEDPYWNGQYAAAFVKGMQEGDDNKYLKVSSCCKHFDAYSLENLPNGTDRHSFNAIVIEQDLSDTYLPAFKACVQQGQASSLMCSYNAINGVPSCANAHLLTELARGQWGFQGYITSDCGAIDDIFTPHNYSATREDTCAAAIKAGTDLDCGGFYQHYVPDAIRASTLTTKDVDGALRNLFRVQYRLGLFDPPDSQPYTKIGMDQVNTPAHKQLALEAAQQGLVLLKNQGDPLPLSAALLSSVAVLGPHANSTNAAYLGNYYGEPQHIVSALEGISRYTTRVRYAAGCDLTAPDTSGLEEAAALAAVSDVTLLFVGLSIQIENEALDRVSVDLPDVQKKLIETVADASQGPVILVLVSGGCVDLSAYAHDDRIHAILFAGYAGQAGGAAIADVLFGHVSPSGKLTQTFYTSDFVRQVDMADMRMRPSSSSDSSSYPGRTYRFFTGPAVYPFGHGLSYANFSAQALSTCTGQPGSVRCHLPLLRKTRARRQLRLASVSARQDGVAVTKCLQVTNPGSGRFKGPAKATLLAFLTPPNAGSGGTPLRSLVAFGGVVLGPGESGTVQVSLGDDDFTLAGDDGQWRAVPGTWRLEVGGAEFDVEV